MVRNPKKGLARLDERVDARPRAIDLGAPALADTDYYVADVAMAVGSYTILNDGEMADGSARNVTVKATQAGGSDDTAGTVTVTGTNVDGEEITEDIIPVNGSTVAGTKAFATVTEVAHAGWVAGGTADRIEVGFGNLIGLPAADWDQVDAANDVFLVVLGGAVVAPTVTWDADEPEKNTVNATAGTYNGTKRLVVLYLEVAE